MRVAIVGATGETGGSILDGLLESPTPFDITALVRPSSLEKPGTLELRKRGVHVVTADLDGPEDDLVDVLTGINVVIATLPPFAFKAQIPLANAAKRAGVQRFVPDMFATVAPPVGVMKLREMKEEIVNHIKVLRLPYTIIDVGWWYQLSIPKLPSGRADYAITMPSDAIAGDGNVPSARTDLRDVGRYVARIIDDPRTLNKMVFAYTELLSQHQVIDLVERLSGETVERPVLSKAAILATIEEARNSQEKMSAYRLWHFQYLLSWGIRGDNNPECAKYLGYLISKDLYPDVRGTSLEQFFQEVLDGKAKAVYASQRSTVSEVH